MRIAFIVGGFPKLSETFILRQATGLIDRGHDVHIYSRREIREPTVQPDVVKYGLLANTHYFNLPSHRLGRAWRAFRALGAALRHRPREVFPCLSVRRYGSLYAVLNNLIFLEAFLGRRYDVILCHFGGNGVDFVALKSVFSSTRFVTMFHGDDLQIGDEQGPEAFSTLKALGDAFLVATDCHGRETLRRYGFPDQRIYTVRYGLHANRIPFRERHAAGNGVRILSVARLAPKKGLDVGIRAAAALQAANPNLHIQYDIIGGGPLRSDLQRLIDELNVSSTVRLLGPQASPEVLKSMEHADIYLLPSRMEQAGVVLLEAQATGLPVVAARVGGVPEMVREGRSALLVSPGDAAEFAGALQQLLDHPERWPLMGREGRAHVEAHHNIDILNDSLERILNGAVH